MTRTYHFACPSSNTNQYMSSHWVSSTDRQVTQVLLAVIAAITNERIGARTYAREESSGRYMRPQGAKNATLRA